MVAFIKKEEVFTNKSYLESLDTIPQEVKDSLDLGLDENLKAFVEQYSKLYPVDWMIDFDLSKIPFGGKLSKEDQKYL